MNMNQDDWNTIRGAIGAVLIELDNPDQVALPVPNANVVDLDHLKLYMLGVSFEVDIGDVLNFTFEALKNAADGLAKAHELAAAVVVPNPSDVSAKQIKTDLANVHNSVQEDQRCEGGIALASAIVGIMKAMKA
jgi:hypothetical protein